MTVSVHADLPRTDDVTWPPSRLQRALRPVAHAWYGSRYDVRVSGAGNVPARGPVLLAPDHIGRLDGPLVAAYSPRPAHALTKVEMFRGVMGTFLRATGQIPLQRFQVDPAGIKICVKVLRDGGVVVVFPEGTRGAGDFARFHHGLAYLALVTGAPVVPVAVLGTREPGAGTESVPPRRTRVDVVFGAPVPFTAQAWPRRRRDVQTASEHLREVLRAHVVSAADATGNRLPGPLPDSATPHDHADSRDIA